MAEDKEGWQLVPQSPTAFMIAAAIGCDWRRGDETICNIWRSMLAAVTQPPSHLAGITLNETEVKSLLYGVPKHEFSEALKKLASWLAEVDDTPPQAAQINLKVDSGQPPPELFERTFAVQHNPNCPSPYLVRLPGKSGIIDMKPHGDGVGFVRHQTGDVLGFGKTFGEAARAALATAAAEGRADA